MTQKRHPIKLVDRFKQMEFYLEPTALSAVAGAAINNDYVSVLSRIGQLPQELISVDSLTPGPYLREAGTSPIHVRLLADAAGSTELPPILVQQSSKRVIDGMHRLAAAKLRGDDFISACLLDCTAEEALVLAIKANILHGLPLSKADRISGAKRILAAHADWSDRAVASVTGMSAKTISALRNRSSAEVVSLEKRLGRDGKRRPVAANEGRKRAAAYMRANPEASLREVAREADVSVGTVHSVRHLMRYATDQVAPGRAPGRLGPCGGQPLVSEQARRVSTRLTEESQAGAPVRRRPAAILTDSQRAKRRRQRAWSEISVKLGKDPAVRYTEGGRAFLRWMAQHALETEDWRQVVSAVPQHWLDDVTAIAESISTEWRVFAAQLRNRSAGGS